MIFNLRINHAFLPKPDFEGYRNNSKKEFKENQNYVGERIPSGASQTILVLLRRWSRKEHGQCLLRMMKRSKYYLQKWFGMEPLTVWNYFEVFRNNIEGHYGQIDKLLLVICLIHSKT
jgi:hypothetical protein